MKNMYGGPSPWMWMQPPPWMMDGPGMHHHVPDIIVPARVGKAMEFITLISQKTMARAAVSDVAIEQIPGQTLTSEEETTATAALQLLTRYFDGKLQPDVWESLRVDAIRKQVERGDVPGRMLHCIACAPGPANPRCPLCRGSGRIMATALGPTQETSDGIQEANQVEGDSE